MVGSSGGAEWYDGALIWERLDHIVKRSPNTILVTTTRDKGQNPTTCAWAVSRGVKVAESKLDT